LPCKPADYGCAETSVELTETLICTTICTTPRQHGGGHESGRVAVDVAVPPVHGGGMISSLIVPPGAYAGRAGRVRRAVHLVRTVAVSHSGGLAGRDAELAVLAGAVGDLAAGRGRSLLIEGEPGIGKSALAAAGLAGVADTGASVLRGVCDELGQRFPLAVMLETLGVHALSDDPRRAEVAAALSGSGGVPVLAGDPVMAGVERLLVLVDRLCAQGPVVLAVDDLQWADEASLLVWRLLSRATGQLPLLLVGACRAVPRRDELDHLRRDLGARGGTVIALGRLTDESVAQLVRDLAGGAPGPRLAERLKSAAGNPLYVREMLGVFSRAGALAADGGVVELTADPAGREDAADAASVSLAGAIADRLDFLSEDARGVLGAAALLGRDFLVGDLAGVLGRPVGGLAGVVRESLAAGVVEQAGERLRFRHDLLRQALYESVPVVLRAGLRRDAARGLMAAGAPVERVAELVLAAGDAADGWEVDWLVDEAAGLIRRSPAVAADLFEHALRHTGDDDPHRAQLQENLATAALLLGRLGQSEQVARRILADTRDAKRRGKALWILGYALTRAGRDDEALALIAQAQAIGVWKVRLTALSAIPLLNLRRYGDAAAAAARVQSDGQWSSDPMALGYALHAGSIVHLSENRPSTAQRVIDQALAAIDGRPQLADLRLLLLNNQVGALVGLERFGEAAELLRTARELAERTGNPRLGLIHVQACELAVQQGRWDDALAELDTIADPAYHAFPTQVPVLADGLAALIAGHRDDERELARRLSALRDTDIPAAAKRYNTGYLLMIRSVTAERAGRTAEAAEALTILLGPEYEALGHQWGLLPMLVRLALAAEDTRTARRAGALAAREARERPSPRATADAEWCRGLLEDDPEPLLAAAAHFRAVDLRLELGHALEDAAYVLARRGDLDAARSTLTQAVSVYDALGAAWDARRAAARLRPHGIRPGVRGARGRPRTGWQALTETELRVAELVAQGRSNPDIAGRLLLSRRTVETHVSHILAKLQARSRREIADLAESLPQSGRTRTGEPADRARR
jgi:DNA-binding CsgD family transcriptional regulator